MKKIIEIESTIFEDCALLRNLRNELMCLSSFKFEVNFFDETEQKANEQPFRNLDFIVCAYRTEILNKKKIKYKTL